MNETETGRATLPAIIASEKALKLGLAMSAGSGTPALCNKRAMGPLPTDRPAREPNLPTAETPAPCALRRMVPRVAYHRPSTLARETPSLLLSLASSPAFLLLPRSFFLARARK